MIVDFVGRRVRLVRGDLDEEIRLIVLSGMILMIVEFVLSGMILMIGMIVSRASISFEISSRMKASN
eukprot:4996998-Heterocapsa_arctica.AAC.1